MTNLTAQKYTFFNLNISASTLLMDSKFWKCICVVLRYPHAHFQEFLKYGKNLCVCAHACVCLFVRFQQLTKKMQYRREMFGLTAQQYYGQSRPKSCLSGASQKMEKLHQQQIKQVWPQGKLEAFFYSNSVSPTRQTISQWRTMVTHSAMSCKCGSIR